MESLGRTKKSFTQSSQRTQRKNESVNLRVHKKLFPA